MLKLSDDLVSRFVKATNDATQSSGDTVFGKIIKQNDELYVQIDGSSNLMPVQTTADTKVDDRVMVLVKDHTATVIGNVSSPAARLDDVEEIRKLAVGEINADRINVDDLSAICAAIGGFNLADRSIYSGEKSDVNSVEQGIYLDKDGQMSIGGDSSHIKYYKNLNGDFKLDVEVDEVILKETGKLSETIDNIQNNIENVREEITTLLRIESSRGTVFKNNAVSTVLSVVIYHGKDRITDIDRLHEVYGNSAYIQWKWQRLDEDSYGIISSTDSRMSNGGFSFTLSPEDVDVKVTFMCELITD